MPKTAPGRFNERTTLSFTIEGGLHEDLHGIPQLFVAASLAGRMAGAGGESVSVRSAALNSIRLLRSGPETSLSLLSKRKTVPVGLCPRFCSSTAAGGGASVRPERGSPVRRARGRAPVGGRNWGKATCSAEILPVPFLHSLRRVRSWQGFGAAEGRRSTACPS